MKKILCLIFVFFGLISQTCANEVQDKIIKEKIAQMLMVGFNGQTLREDNPIYKDIKELKIGGVILYSRNEDKSKTKLIKNIKDFNQLKKLISDLNKISTTPLFVGIEQEGGLASKLSPSYFVISMYSAKDLGFRNNLELTRKEAEKTAKTLSDLGINVNFAPCIDINSNPYSKIIGIHRRSYSSDPEIVYNHAREVILAQNKYSVLSVLRNYPSLGNSDINKQYKGILDITETYKEEEGEVLKRLISNNLVNGILVNHVYNKNIDPIFPISMSRIGIQKELINKMKYQGLIFADDIENYQLIPNYTLEERLKNLILAGTDVIILGNNYNYNENVAKNSVEIIFNLFKNGTITEERINYSYNKIIKVKKELKSGSINQKNK